MKVIAAVLAGIATITMSIAASASGIYEDWLDASRNRTVPLRMFVPMEGTAPYPVIIFSHGLGGSRDNYSYLAEHWVKHGYFVLLLQHPGSDDSVWRSAMQSGKEAIMKSMSAAANGQNWIARAQDVSFAIDQLEEKNETDAKLKGKLDLSRLGVAGHSFGAGTALAVAGVRFVAGGQSRLKDPRVKSAIYMSPPVNPMQARTPAVFGEITIPGMVMTGTEDGSIIGATKQEYRRIPFDAIPAAEQYLVNFNGGDHMIFSGRLARSDKDALFQPMILKLSTAFFDAYLRDDKEQLSWLKSGARAYLGNNAQFEVK